MALPMWGPPHVSLCHGVLHNRLAMLCTKVMLYLLLEFIFGGACNRCLVSMMPLISGLHNMSQTEIGAPTLAAH